MTSRTPCRFCGATTIREGASKCPVCKRWIRPQPARPLTSGGVAIASAALMALGAVGGAVGTWVAMTPASAASRPESSAAASASPSGAASGPPGGASSDAAKRPLSRGKGGAVAFAEPKVFPLEVAPVDAVLSDDDARIFVLGDDGSVRVLSREDGQEIKKIPIAGRATELRLLAGKYLALVGNPGLLPIVDLATLALRRVDVGGAAVDVVALEDTPSFVVATATRRLARFGLENLRVEGGAPMPRLIGGLSTVRSGDKELLAVLLQGKKGGALGSIDFFDPKVSPFASTRNSVPSGLELRRGSSADTASILVVDKLGAELIEVGPERPMRTASVGRVPLAAFRLQGRYVVTLDAPGNALVSDATAKGLEAKATLALGAGVSDAALFPDGQALLVALGGGGRERGAFTAVVAGDPPQVTAKIPTGLGSHSVSIGKSGRYAVVTAHWARTIALLERTSP